LLIWLDRTSVWSTIKNFFQKPSSSGKSEADPDVSDEEVAHEMQRVTSNATSEAANDSNEASATDGLQVRHLTKSFGRNTAVDNVSFGVKRGEVFALLGPNGAGKSTTISLIRGDIKPSRNGGDILVENVSVVGSLAHARQYLGVCPQFDAIDQMSVHEHLAFYARVRGIADIHHNVDAVLRAVGLTAFKNMQAHALSGGNKRKLSLGIALMGNPTVVLLDEPSSGLDAAAKRIMWRTLAATVPGRSILLTTHSMEEADALAGRAGILAKRMLALGTTEQLRHRFGDALHVHFVLKGAPHTGEAEIAKVRDWIAEKFPGVEVEQKTYHGQMRFAVPASEVVRRADIVDQSQTQSSPKVKSLLHSDGTARLQMDTDSEDSISSAQESEAADERQQKPAASNSQSAIGSLIVLIEENKQALGIEHYSVSPTTLDQVFLTIVGKHGVKEENTDVREKKRSWWKRS
jgi:ATP-binding cassette, subfamily A (ABC1), member 3